ncbi:hypothetical protein G9A89_001906 [Geosiphon pyriformis]|nr:hypothetical protein G9A89_001906 [Geosiphon pyriformis]
MDLLFKFMVNELNLYIVYIPTNLVSIKIGAYPFYNRYFLNDNDLFEIFRFHLDPLGIFFDLYEFILIIIIIIFIFKIDPFLNEYKALYTFNIGHKITQIQPLGKLVYKNDHLKIHLKNYFLGGQKTFSRKKSSFNAEFGKRLYIKVELITYKATGFKPNQLIKVDKLWQEGFLILKDQIFEKIEKLLISRSPQNPKKIYFTGWGVGGAYAAIAALSWKLESYKRVPKNAVKSFKFTKFEVQTITFGAPRLGNIYFARFINKFLNVKRVTHSNDHVPHFPVRVTQNNALVHHELELWIETKKTCDCTNDWKLWECTGFHYGKKLWQNLNSKEPSQFLLSAGGMFGENPYFLTNDELEQDRLHLQHYLCRYAWGSNFCAPIHNDLLTGMLRALDVGCGPGTWVMEMASEYHKCSFTGVDTSSMFPSEIKPENVNFFQANILLGLPLNNPFDYVHMRFLGSLFTATDWETAIREVIRLTRSGGWIEILETDLKFYNEGPVSKSFMGALMSQQQAQKIDLTNLPTLVPQLMYSFGLTVINSAERKWCMSDSEDVSDRLGQLATDNMKQLFQVLKPNLSSLMKLSSEQYDRLLRSYVIEVNELKTYCKSFRFWARKPYPSI